MSRQFKIFFSITVIIAILAIAVNYAQAVSISPSIEKSLNFQNAGSPDSLIKVVLFAEDNKAFSAPGKIAASQNLNFKNKHKLVINNLREENSGILESISNQISEIYPAVHIKKFWIAPALSFEIPLSAIDDLLEIPGVVSIIEDGSVDYIKPIETPLAASRLSSEYTHLSAMKIPTLWAAGIDGSGRILCNFDTGVDGAHPALQSKWRGNIASSEATWFAPRQDVLTPCDVVGHGTQTMGIMVGGTDSDTIGVAPGAQWISAAVIDQGQTLSNTISDIIAAFEWAVDPDGNPETVDDMPDVILNSWGIPTTIMAPCDETFYQVIDNVEAAGIVTVFAAGNEGPNPYSLRLPANSASTPLNSFAVGAIDHNTNLIASFSSRGPSSCDSSEIKPEVVAPGVGIYTTAKGGGYRYSTGTSMAAPIIAGLVTLMRQYNPEATVEEIKNAIIASATDLGAVGEDNNYGHGLPDAAKAIALLPMPSNPEIRITGTIIGGDGIADPGETVNFFIRIGTIANIFDSLTGYLISGDSRIEINKNKASFIFGPNITQSGNLAPYELSVDDSALHGDIATLYLALDLPFGIPYDTLTLELTVGTPPNGHLMTHVSQQVELTVSDFGQFGMAENSIYPAGGRGFRYSNSDNLLYEAGIIVGRNILQLSSSVRDSLGRADQSDFAPVSDITFDYSASTDGMSSFAKFIDSNADIQIPIAISQKIINYNIPGEDQYFIVRYYLKNESGDPVTDLSFGFFADFDLGTSGDRVGIFSENELFYQASDQYAVGILPFTNSTGIQGIDNGGEKMALSNQDKFAYITNSGIIVDETSIGDFMTVISFGPYDIQPLDSVEISFAIIAGATLSDVQFFANLASERYYGFTDIVEPTNIIPDNFELLQNYPNPFNPATTISFQLGSAAHARLSIINLLGQEVAVLIDEPASAGNYTVRWEGIDKNGTKAASGIYFYRLETDSKIKTKKMVMLK